MYTVCYVDDEGRDRWDRFETKAELLADEKLRQYMDCDMLVFPHEADELSVSGDELAKEL